MFELSLRMDIARRSLRHVVRVAIVIPGLVFVLWFCGCKGKQPVQGCGDSVCDPLETADDCPEDCSPCDGLSAQGCCDGDTLHWCHQGTARSTDCGQLGCGWSGSEETGYLCGYDGEDPLGNHARSCGCETVKMRGVPKIWRGTAEPQAVCLTDGQILAIGALMTDYGQGLENYCTATLVAEDAVLTAAHCLLDRWGDPIIPADVFFAVGDDVANADEIFDVSEVHPHTGYDGEAGHDLGVVVLSESAVAVLPQMEPLPVNRRDLTRSFVGQLVQNVGYGATHDDPRNTRRWWTAEPVTDVLGLEFEVYGNGWSSVCHGDSGGPSLYGFDDRAVKVVGTVSWGDVSCVDYDHFCRMDGNTSFLDPYLAGFDECLGLDLVGLCEGDMARWCENGELKQECCAGNCELNNEGRYRCDDAPPGCGATDRLGECRGDELVWCDVDTVRRRFCSICGQGRCAWVDDTVGYNCVSD